MACEISVPKKPALPVLGDGIGFPNTTSYALDPTSRSNAAASSSLMEAQTTSSAKYSVFAIIAIVAAVLSFTTGAVLGLVFAMVAILFGLIGMISASRSSVRGGFVGMLSIFAGVVGIFAAAVKAIMWFF
jgi:hypothetical protein